MTKNEYTALLQIKTKTSSCITADDLNDKTDRTLLFGRTTENTVFHVYLKNNHIHVLTYAPKWLHNACEAQDVNEITPINDNDYIPSFKVYPDRSDFEFCKLLKSRNVEIPMFAWIDDSFTIARKHNPFDDTVYYGFTK